MASTRRSTTRARVSSGCARSIGSWPTMRHSSRARKTPASATWPANSRHSAMRQRSSKMPFICDEHAASEEQQLALDKICSILASRRDRIAESEGDLDRKIEATIVDCRKALAALAHVSFQDGRRKSARRLAKGWRRTLRRAARARTACAASSDTIAVPRLAQEHTGLPHAPLLCCAKHGRRQCRRRERRPSELADVLGHLNDIATLVAARQRAAGPGRQQ